MTQEKVCFEQFLAATEADRRPFIQDLHNYLLDNGCKVTIEEKKSGLFASYKFGKPQRAMANLFFRNKGMFARIYGENIGKYPDFLNTLPAEMVQSIDGAGICKRLVNNTCSPKCTGYDFIIRGKHFQKCRYNCFEFLVAGENKPYIKSFIEHELTKREVVTK